MVRPVILPILLVSCLPLSPVRAQLRPLEPVEWSVFGADRGTVALGMGFQDGQTASRAGTRGRLLELGSYRATVGLGRTVIQISGTAVRSFRDEDVVSAPLQGVRSPDGHRRVDTGDHRVSTLVRLTPSDWSTQATVRFGVRLPTTDDEVGLERDQTDFFASLSGRRGWGPFAVGLETGVGIYGTRDSNREQVDVLLFMGRLEYGLGWGKPIVTVVGQHDTRPNPTFRGTEDLGELRLGLQIGGDRWVRLQVARGFHDVSPDLGLLVGVGLSY